MPPDYPHNVVWYIEARKWGWPHSEPQMGTAVAIALVDPATKRLQKFLLTAAHTVRAPEWGPVLEEILCFRPGKGYTPPAVTANRISGRSAGAFTAKVSGIVPVANDVPDVDRRPSLDWVVLEVKEPGFQDAEVVRGWADASDSALYDIAGYPGGAIPWAAGVIVRCNVQNAFRRNGDAGPGLLQLTGPGAAAPGMSGGAVLDAKGNLIGIHRAQTPGTLTFHAVAARGIRDALFHHGWSVAQFEPLAPISRGAARGTDGSRSGTSFELRVTAKEVQFDGERVLRRKPVEGLKLGFHAHEFRPKETCDGVTDRDGVATLVVTTDAQTPKQHVKGYLLCKESPPHLAGKAPLISDRYAAVQSPGVRTTFGEPLALAGVQQLQVDIVPYVERERYYECEIPTLLDRMTAAAPSSTPASVDDHATGANEDVIQAIVELGNRFKVTASKLAAGFGRRMSAGRPAFLVDGPMIWESEDLAPRLRSQLPAIVRLTDQDDATICAGVVVARNTILTADLARPVRAIQDNGSAHTVTASLWRDPALGLALYDVPGLDVAPLLLAAAPPYADPTCRKVVVIGYPDRDARVPAEVIAEVYGDRLGVKRVMPGNLLSVTGMLGAQDGQFKNARLTHDAMTMRGVAGGAVIDLETGVLLGIHVSGEWRGASKRNHAVAIWDALDSVRKVLELRRARIVSPMTAVRAPARAEGLPFAVPYDPDFLGSWLVPMPRLRGDDIDAAGRVLDYVHFSLLFDQRRRCARYIACNFDRRSRKRIPRRADRWLLDPRIASRDQPSFEHFEARQWDRGHLISPSVVAWGEYAEAERAQRSAFYMTNVAPQLPVFNRSRWSELENFVYFKQCPAANRLCVFTGPIFRKDDVFVEGVQIPRSFWMVAVYEGDIPAVFAYSMDQYELGDDDEVVAIKSPVVDADEYAVNLTELQADTGLTFEVADTPD